MVWSEGNMSLKNPVTTPRIDPGTVRLVAQRLNHYATPGPIDDNMITKTALNVQLKVINSRMNDNKQFHPLMATFIHTE